MTLSYSSAPKRRSLFQRPNETSPQSNVRHVLKSEQAHRWPVELRGSNTRVCPDFVSMTFSFQKLLLSMTCWFEVLDFISLVRQDPRGSCWKMVIVAVEVLQAGSKQLVVVSVRISTGERHNFGAAALMSTITSFLWGKAGGSAFKSKLVEIFGPVWTFLAEQLLPHFAWTTAAAPSVRLRVFLSVVMSASMARRGCRASSDAPLTNNTLFTSQDSWPSLWQGCINKYGVLDIEL